MATKIIDQVIEYDNSAKAWARFEPSPSMAADLVKYYDDKNEAIKAALPGDLREWVEAHTGEPGRVLRAAVLLAEERVKPCAECDPGVYSSYDNDCNVTIPWCSCEDWRWTKYSAKKAGQRCKHLYAAEKLYSEFRAEYYPPAPSLWDLARSAIEENQYNTKLNGTIIWRDASDTRHAWLQQVQSDPYAGERMAHGTWLYLEVSGHPASLPVATLHYGLLTDAPRWEFDCRETEYKEWVRELRGGD